MPEEPSLSVHYMPQFVGEADLAGATVVVIDLLRASTTICTALAAGATGVRPYLEVGEVMRAAEGLDRSQIVLGGERGGEIISGFDLGNSPAEYTADVVFGREVFFTTTNGTAALRHARLAKRIVVGALVNLSTVAESIASDSEVHLLCAGTSGHVSREDRLAAGAIANKLLEIGGSRETSDAGQAVVGEWLELVAVARSGGRSIEQQLDRELRETLGGKNLISIGMDDDLPRCAAIDTVGLVPIYDAGAGVIRVG